MVGRLGLLLAVVVGSTSLLPVGLATNQCSAIERAAGLCVDASVGQDSVELGASETHPGSSANRGPSHKRSADDPLPKPPVRLPECASSINWASLPQCQPPTARAGAPAVTLSDIATFRPQPGVDHMQPDGWTVAGLDTNFYALAGRPIVPGTLLGRPAEARFTAVGFHWTYGDGTAADRGTPGGTWDQLRVAEFDPTPTSHVYAANGDYTIRLRIAYRAEYRFDSAAFVPIAGTISLPANDLHITVGDAKTVLVDRDCMSAPAGPGC